LTTVGLAPAPLNINALFKLHGRIDPEEVTPEMKVTETHRSVQTDPAALKYTYYSSVLLAASSSAALRRASISKLKLFFLGAGFCLGAGAAAGAGAGAGLLLKP